MNDKIVFFDIDGTLLDEEKKVPNSTKEAIVQLQEKGVHVAIATGRAPFMFEDLRKELNIPNYISFNGQYVVFENEVIHRQQLPVSTLHQFTSFASESGFPLVFMNEREMKATVMQHHFVAESLGTLHFDHPPYEPAFYEAHDIYQALLFCEEGQEQSFLHEYPQFQFIRWHDYSMDILPNGGSKAAGIYKFIEKLGFQHDQVFAFGDGLNDIEMIKAAGTGIAMGNAREEVKIVANFVTRNVDDDGILAGLKWAGLL